MLQTYHGSCHCGALRFRAQIDLSQGSVQCNCSICTKLRWWALIVPMERFQLLSGTAQQSVYTFHRHVEQHYFCAVCGIHPYLRGQSPRWGAFIAVNVACLDDLDPVALSVLSITELDGRNDCWEAAPSRSA